MASKITITPDDFSQVNDYLGVDIQELNALSDPSLYTTTGLNDSNNPQINQNGEIILDLSKEQRPPSDDSNEPSISQNEPEDDILGTYDDPDIPLERRPLPQSTPLLTAATNQNELISLQTQATGDNGQIGGSDDVAATALSVISGLAAVEMVENSGNIKKVQIDPPLSPTNSDNAPSPSNKSNGEVKLTRQQQKSLLEKEGLTPTNKGIATTSNTPNGHTDADPAVPRRQLQVERILVRKQQIQEWGTYRIDKFGRVVAEQQAAAAAAAAATTSPATSQHESSLTKNGGTISPSESTSNLQSQNPQQPSNINTLQARASNIDPKAIAKKLEREAKWVQMVAKWDDVKPSVLKRRVRKGIPSSMRGVVWDKIMSLDAIRNSHPNRYYYDLLSRPVNELDELQIRKDLPRLMQDNIMFRSPEAGSRTVMCSGQAMLYNILKSYSVHDPAVGYVQGMDTVAAPALLYFPEETTFWFLERLLNSPKYKLRDLYLDGFPLARKYVYIHEHLVKKYLPNLWKTMQQQDVQHTGYAFRWYTMRYAQFAPELSYRVLDIYLHEGEKILYRIALALLSHYEKTLIAHPEDILETLKSIETDYELHAKDNSDFLINKALKINLTTADVVKLGEQYEKEEEAATAGM